MLQMFYKVSHEKPPAIKNIWTQMIISLEVLITLLIALNLKLNFQFSYTDT